MEQVFEITVTSCENYTWQGTLRAADRVIPFQSELELLLELARLLPPEGLSPERRPAWGGCGEGLSSP